MSKWCIALKNWKLITITIIATVIVTVTAVSALAYLLAQNQPNQYDSVKVATNQTPSVMQDMPIQQMPGNSYPETTPSNQNQLLTKPSTNEDLTTQELPVLYTPTTSQITIPSNPSTGRWGGGCMGRGYYGTNAYTNTQTTSLLTIDQVVQIAKAYVTSLNNPELSVEEVEEYTANFYVLVEEKTTGFGAFELLIDKYTGIVTPEMGPNIMWNTKYGFSYGYCNWYNGVTTGTPTITVSQAEANAQQYLNTHYPGTTVDEVKTFYGYYTFEVIRNSGIYGRLSVNGYTGEVWFHTWHGTYIQGVTVA
jgi:hypothetical protein